MPADFRQDQEGFRRLRVLKTRAETNDAKSVVFEHPPGFRWRAGQHVGLRFDHLGSDVRRTYSISSAPSGTGSFRITVKRVKDGLVSNHVNDHVVAGDYIDVTPPFGGFCLDPDPQARRTYYFFGAGSGITPLYAMIRAVLDGEPHSAVRLAYGNTSNDKTIFRDGLSRHEESSDGKLTVRYVFSAPSWHTDLPCWRKGRIDADAVACFIDEHPPYAQDTRYYICGPGGMNDSVRAALMGLDVPEERIHSEHFGTKTPLDDSVSGTASRAEVLLNGEKFQVEVASGQTVLNAVRGAGAKPRYSCESGVCGACRARLLDGKVHHRAHMALSDAEIASGQVLTCQALPTTPEIRVEYA